MPPTRTNLLPKNYKAPRAKAYCSKGHSMDDAYITFDKYAVMRRRCATCQKEAVRAIHKRRMRTDPIYAGSRRAAWAAMKAVEQAEAARLKALRDALKRAANG